MIQKQLIEQFGRQKNPLLSENFDKIYTAFDKKDYWDTEGQIKTLLGNWERAKKAGDKGADQYTEQDIIDHIKEKNRAMVLMMYEKMKKAIKKNDIDYLKSILRHDQLVSKAFFMDITGKKLPKSTKEIHKFLEDFFGIDENIVKESKEPYVVYHNSYSSAVQAAEKYAESKGYLIDEDDWAREITFGPKKPSDGKTNRATIGLFKNGKEQKKALHIQVYGMGNGKYELNAYIN